MTTTHTTTAVNRRLTTKRRTRAVENPDYDAFIRRAVKAYGRRVATGDIEDIAPLVALSTEVDEAITAAIRGLRSFGYTWADIALRLGITRQAVQKRWGDPS